MGEHQHSHTLTRTGLSPSTAPLSKGLQLHAWFLTVRPAGRPAKMLPTTPHTQPLPGITCIRFGLIRFRSPLLSESLLFSLPVGTEMFHFPTFPPHTLYIQARVTGHDSSQVSPFGHPRITARLPTPQGLSQAPTSFIGSRCQGIHHVPFIACHNTHTNSATQSKPRHHCERTKHHTTPATPTTPTPNKQGRQQPGPRVLVAQQIATKMLASTMEISNNTPRHRQPPRIPRNTTSPGTEQPTTPPTPPTAEGRGLRLILQNPNSVPPNSPLPTPHPPPRRKKSQSPVPPPSREATQEPTRHRPHTGDRPGGCRWFH